MFKICFPGDEECLWTTDINPALFGVCQLDRQLKTLADTSWLLLNRVWLQVMSPGQDGTAHIANVLAEMEEYQAVHLR